MPKMVWVCHDSLEPPSYCAQHAISSAPSEVTLVSGKQTQFLDYVSPCVLVVCATSVFCAAALEDGSVNVYSPTGRRHVTLS
jgi:protein HIRA/HIR1